jgi:hypothetical protein
VTGCHRIHTNFNKEWFRHLQFVTRGCIYTVTQRPRRSHKPIFHFIHQWLYSPLLGLGLFFSFIIVLFLNRQ